MRNTRLPSVSAVGKSCPLPRRARSASNSSMTIIRLGAQVWRIGRRSLRHDWLYRVSSQEKRSWSGSINPSKQNGSSRIGNPEEIRTGNAGIIVSEGNETAPRSFVSHQEKPLRLTAFAKRLSVSDREQNGKSLAHATVKRYLTVRVERKSLPPAGS